MVSVTEGQFHRYIRLLPVYLLKDYVAPAHNIFFEVTEWDLLVRYKFHKDTSLFKCIMLKIKLYT